MESEKELKKDFFMEALIDYGYVDLGPYEVKSVDPDNEEITFVRRE